ncbi:hypothetical protein EGH82_05165 [Vibrio ponticus]|uniref:Uncharacterized protein n=1 Tax=Vibrio ponticus TaxID=265668 RepID=A0A3N3E3T9_9VIBR|nr:hypothetical protein EGH82_05165 [Vibrio ponticus]
MIRKALLVILLLLLLSGLSIIISSSWSVATPYKELISPLGSSTAGHSPLTWLSHQQNQTQSVERVIMEGSETSSTLATIDSSPTKHITNNEQLATPSSTTHVVVSNENKPLSTNLNLAPEINLTVFQAIQAELNQWSLTLNSPINKSINLNGLFVDPDNDLLSYRAEIRAPDLKISGYPAVQISGVISHLSEINLLVAANDGYQQQWTEANFTLPTPTIPTNASHPLEGETLYRLVSSYELNNKIYDYEVVYCQAFKFNNQEVFFASANNKHSCPEEEQLNKIGHYQIIGNELTVTSSLSAFDAQQTWQVIKKYSSAIYSDTTNWLTSIMSKGKTELYTLQDNRAISEKRLNSLTGEFVFQLTPFDYLLPTGNDEYLHTKIGLYVYDYQTETVGPHNETVDADLNMHAIDTVNLSCKMVAPLFEDAILAGPGDYGIDIISSVQPSAPYSINCLEFIRHPVTGGVSLAFDLNFTPYEQFLHGQKYSYVLKPPHYLTNKVEPIKLNLLYRTPD